MTERIRCRSTVKRGKYVDDDGNDDVARKIGREREGGTTPGRS